MRKSVTVFVGILSLAAHAGSPEGTGLVAPKPEVEVLKPTPRVTPKGVAPKGGADKGAPPAQGGAGAQPGAAKKLGPGKGEELAAENKPVEVTPDILEQYIRYRRESDPVQQAALQKAMQQAQTEGIDMMARLKEIEAQDRKVREKHGLNLEDFPTVDRMVRDIVNARFAAESKSQQALLARLEKNAATSEGAQKDMAVKMVALLKKQREEGPALREQRARYGEVAVEMVLKREKDLKELWERQEALAVESLNALP